MSNRVKINKEHVFLLVFIGIFMWYGCSSLFNHSLTHPFPYGYMASDAFLHKGLAQDVYDFGDMRNLPEYYSGFDDVVNANPPLLNHITALFSHLTGFEVYDVMYLFVFLFTLVGVLLFYLIIRKFSKNTAILMLGLVSLMFVGKFYTGYTWGQWDFYYGTFFLIASVWLIQNIKLKGAGLLLGIMLAASFLAHTVEGIWAAAFIIFYLLVKLVIKKFDFSEFKKILAAGAVAFVLSLYYLHIFLLIWVPERSGRLFTLQAYPSNWGYLIPHLTDFGIIPIIIIVAGLLLSILFIKKKNNIGLLFSGFMLVMGYTYYIGFDKAFQMRMYWPVYLSALFGFALLYGIRFIFKKWKIIFSMVLSIALIFVFTGIYYEPLNSRGIMDPYRWEQLMWAKENTPQDADIYYFYGDIYSQNSIFRNTQRKSHYVQNEDFVNTLKNGTIKRYYQTRFHGRTSSGLPYRKGLGFGDHQSEMEARDENYFIGPKDICNYDYYVFDKATIEPVLAQYNLAIRDELLNHTWIEKVFENELLSVLKNSDKGADCIG